jgi:hypothetical protein
MRRLFISGENIVPFKDIELHSNVSIPSLSTVVMCGLDASQPSQLYQNGSVQLDELTSRV